MPQIEGQASRKCPIMRVMPIASPEEGIGGHDAAELKV